MKTHGHVSASLAALLTLLLAPGRSSAAGPLLPNGQPITTSDYKIDMVQGPILSSSRSTGLAGSTAAIAEGVDGIPVNAAAPVIRSPWSVDYFDYDVGIGFTTAGTLESVDFDNNGRIRFEDGTNRDDTGYNRFLFATIGGTLQWGKWGVGLNLDAQNFRLGDTPTVPDAPPNLTVSLERVHVLVARHFWDQQLAAGVGLRGVTLRMDATENVDGSGQTARLVEMTGGGLQAGFVYAPFAVPMRVGFTWRSRVAGITTEGSRATTTPEGDSVIGTRYLPNEVALPWELEAGFAYQLGQRPLNPRWVNPREEVKERARALRATLPPRSSPDYQFRRSRVEGEIEALEEGVRRELKQRYAALSRQKVLISASLLVSGPVEDGVGVESFLRQRVERSGRSITLQPRLGAEVEPIAGSLQVRAGTYVEPSRFDTEIVRVHGTAGFDLRLFEWAVFGIFDEDTAWRFGGFIDGAQRYSSFGVTAGIWH